MGMFDELETRLVEWGSCDGCSNGRNYCVECKQPRESFNDEVDDLVLGKHKDDCAVARALGVKP